MERQGKHISDVNEFWAYLPIIQKFPRIHNTLKADFQALLDLTDIHKDDEKKFVSLCRACVKGLFSLIEADIYYYNLFDKYDGYDDKHRFFEKFKKTFVQICRTWNREDLQKDYFSKSLEDLKELKNLRDKLAHPKELEDIIVPSANLLPQVQKAFLEYDTFIATIMSNFFISTTLPLNDVR
jgi:hypothetical protein